MNKGKDISTMFTKEENKKNGRLGYYNATREFQSTFPRGERHWCPLKPLPEKITKQ